MATIDDFKARLKGGGARPNLFRVLLTFPGFAGGDTELTSFMCKTATIPASTVGDIVVPYQGRQIHVAGDRTFEPLSLTIINDTDFAVRNAFERWMNGLNEHLNNKGILAPTDYQSDVQVEQLDRQGSVIKTYNFVGCHPTSVAAIELGWESNDAIEEFAVEMQITRWASDTTT